MEGWFSLFCDVRMRRARRDSGAMETRYLLFTGLPNKRGSDSGIPKGHSFQRVVHRPLYWYAEILRPQHVEQVNDISTSHDIALENKSQCLHEERGQGRRWILNIRASRRRQVLLLHACQARQKTSEVVKLKGSTVTNLTSFEDMRRMET